MKKTILAILMVASIALMNTNQATAAIPMQEQLEVVTAVEETTTAQAEVAPITKAEKKMAKKAKKKAMGGKSQLVALLLCIFLGGLGIHRFYLGYIWQGVVQLLTAGVFGIWWLIDLIRIITGDLTPKGGSYDSTL